MKTTDLSTRPVGPFDIPTPFMTEEQAAARLQLSPNTLRAWRVLRSGPEYLKVGRSIRYDQADVDSWARAQKEAA